MKAASRMLGWASALALTLLLVGPARALDDTRAPLLPPEARALASRPGRPGALPIACAPRQGSPVGAALGFGLAIAGAAALSRRRTDRLR